jgi:type VI secretion system protein
VKLSFFSKVDPSLTSRRGRPLRWSGLAFALLLAACGGNRPSFFGSDITLQAEIDPGANQNNPVKVELVIVYDKKLLEEFLKLSAHDWFKKREQYKKDHPEDKDFISWYWEWVPGEEIEPQPISIGTGARAGLVFADYMTNQDHRARFDQTGDVRLHLKEEDFTVEQKP